MSLVPILFEAKGKIVSVLAKEGISLLESAHRAGLPLSGACEGSLACTTCHIILDKKSYNRTKDSLTEREEDLLDGAKELSTTSRLGCQVKISPLLTHAHVRIPRISKNIELQVKKTNAEQPKE